jgi:hypothetical protein
MLAVLRKPLFSDHTFSRRDHMSLSRGTHKVECVRVTFVPTDDEQGFRNIPSTFSPSSRTYGWKRMHEMECLIVPKKISSNQIVVEMFVEGRKGKVSAAQVHKAVERFVHEKVGSEWQGLKLARISRAVSAVPPERRFVRGTIEEILGAKLERN